MHDYTFFSQINGKILKFEGSAFLAWDIQGRTCDIFPIHHTSAPSPWVNKKTIYQLQE
jgi:hypothetical protein